jgi:group II intron reverse transcriptase/maturase
MRDAEAVRAIHQGRGAKGLPLERVYRHLFNPELYLEAYDKIRRNDGAMTKGTTGETVDGTSLRTITRITESLRQGRYRWTPVRREYIPKLNGKSRPLGIPTWGDKLVQEALRSLLGPYYEQRFSARSHGFRPRRGCHTALEQIVRTWKGTVWFIEGDIKGCFDNIDHQVLLEVIRRDIHDGRVVGLIDGLLRAGYMEDWRYHDTPSGTPQGGVISPLLANIYLNEMDRYVEGTLIPEYTRGDRRRSNPEYSRVTGALRRARERSDSQEITRLRRLLRTLPSRDGSDPSYRRLRYVRYADDFLLGFIGPRKEAEAIRDRLRDWLRDNLRLTLSDEKTLITHASGEKANFLGYEITVTWRNDLVSAKSGHREANGNIALLMPRKAVAKVRDRYSRRGKVLHRPEVIPDSEYTTFGRYQAALRGLYNYYCLAVDVSRRMGAIRWYLETSLTKTLAAKAQCSVAEVYRRYGVTEPGNKYLRLVVERPGRPALVATFGGFPLVRKRVGHEGFIDFRFDLRRYGPSKARSETVARLLAGVCELCGQEGPLEAHHVRKLADLDRPGRRDIPAWKQVMMARRRKALMVCRGCHDDIHAGRYDGPTLRRPLESRER